MLLSSVILLGCQDSVTPLLKYLPVVYIPYTCLPPIYLHVFKPFLAVIWVNVTSTASLCMSCKKYFFLSPVLVVNWVSYVFPPNYISRRSTHFPALAPLGLVFVFSQSLVSRSPAYIYLSSWIFLSLLFDSYPHLQSFFLGRHFWWWHLLSLFGIDSWWCHQLDHFCWRWAPIKQGEWSK